MSIATRIADLPEWPNVAKGNYTDYATAESHAAHERLRLTIDALKCLHAHSIYRQSKALLIDGVDITHIVNACDPGNRS